MKGWGCIVLFFFFNATAFLYIISSYSVLLNYALASVVFVITVTVFVIIVLVKVLFTILVVRVQSTPVVRFVTYTTVLSVFILFFIINFTDRSKVGNCIHCTNLKRQSLLRFSTFYAILHARSRNTRAQRALHPPPRNIEELALQSRAQGSNPEPSLRAANCQTASRLDMFPSWILTSRQPHRVVSWMFSSDSMSPLHSMSMPY